MTEREKAPGWVIPGILILELFFSIVGLLGHLDIIHLNLVKFRSEYGEYAAFSYYPFWWLMNALPILFYGWIAIASIKNKWRKAVTIGSLIKVGCEIIRVVIFVMELSAKNRYELSSLFKISIPLQKVTTLATFVGILLVVWNTKTTKTVKISITGYVLLLIIQTFLWMDFETMGINTYITIIAPLLVLALFMIYFYNRQPNN